MEDLDIFRSAKILVEQHGPRSIVEAAKRQVDLKSKGDMKGAAVWGRILLAINKLLVEKSPDGNLH